jgi:chorismate mutase
MNSTYHNAIQPLRDQIDRIDRELVALLKQRSQVVQQVGHVKQSLHPTACFIRPAREANMTEAAMGWDAAPFPRAYMALIWRNIINGSLNIEQSITASAHAPGGRLDYLWLAREYLGAATQVTPREESRDALGDVMAGRSMVAVLPMPGPLETDGWRDGWWAGLATQPRLRVFATAPLFDMPGIPRALLVGDVEPEPSGRDACLLVTTGDGTVEGAEKLTETTVGSVAHTLWRLERFLPPEELAGIQALHAKTGMDIHCIGSYALPLNLK